MRRMPNRCRKDVVVSCSTMCGSSIPTAALALTGLSFEAEPGTTVALVGPSGAGKSTALSLIPRLHDVTAGAVRIDGADVRDVTVASLRDAIAYVGQEALLFDETVAANIRMAGPDATRSTVAAAAEAAAADLHRGAAGGVRHPGRSGRAAAVGRPAAADRAGPRAAARSAHPAAG